MKRTKEILEFRCEDTLELGLNITSYAREGFKLEYCVWEDEEYYHVEMWRIPKEEK